MNGSHPVEPRMSPETSNLSKAPSQSTLDSVASDQSSVLGPDSDDDDGLDDLNNTNRHGFIGRVSIHLGLIFELTYLSNMKYMKMCI